MSDAVVENYTPRVMQNFGLSYESLRAVKPDIIMLSMPGFGVDGPWRNYTAFAWSTEQMAGIDYLTGYEGGPPLFSNTTGGDPLAGLMGAIALFAAIRHRRRTGEGQFIDLSQLEASTWFAGDALVEAALTGRSRVRSGNRHERMAPHNTYRCRDGHWVAIACRNDSDWAQLAGLIGHGVWAETGHPHTQLAGRQDALQQIDGAIAAWTADKSAQEVAHLCQRAGVPAGAVLDGKDLSEDPHLAAREFFMTIQRAWVGPKRYPGQPFRMSRCTPVTPSAAPTLGQHSRAVLQSLLDIRDSEFDELESADVTGSVPLAAR